MSNILCVCTFPLCMWVRMLTEEGRYVEGELPRVRTEADNAARVICPDHRPRITHACPHCRRRLIDGAWEPTALSRHIVAEYALPTMTCPLCETQ